jgi:hypothetical protein
MLLVEIPIAAATLQMGRHLEIRLRVALLEKMPRLNHRYFHSRLLSDLACHAHSLRSIPDRTRAGRSAAAHRVPADFDDPGAGAALPRQPAASRAGSSHGALSATGWHNPS